MTGEQTPGNEKQNRGKLFEEVVILEPSDKDALKGALPVAIQEAFRKGYLEAGQVVLAKTTPDGMAATPVSPPNQPTSTDQA